MFRHIVVVRFTADTTRPEMEALAGKLRTLPEHIPQIVRSHAELDAGHKDTNYHLAIVTDFDSYEDFTEYRDHPAHVAVARELGAHREHSAVAQYDLPTLD